MKLVIGSLWPKGAQNGHENLRSEMALGAKRPGPEGFVGGGNLGGEKSEEGGYPCIELLQMLKFRAEFLYCIIISVMEIKFTNQMKDRLYDAGQNRARRYTKREKLPYPMGHLGEALTASYDSLGARIALAEWCLLYKQGMTVYRQGLKDLGL